MTVTLKQLENIPEAYPDAPSGLSTAAAALADVAWARIEAYTSHRYSERSVVWIVEGPGEWSPPLQPATITRAEIFAAGYYEDVDLEPTAFDGVWLTGAGPYRFTATVGDDDADIPAAVTEAVKRLAEYLAQDPGTAGAASERVDVTDIESVSVSRSPSWMARALQNSGAADLLRGYR
ncbi:MAG: hypothetical protein M9932_02360 [Xanthobacteraceae bacterium]|nr:hypothetical protein [Xanthobacteraceae bacterium]